jgi:hypothetical protein
MVALDVQTKEKTMIRLFARHPVTDYATWRKAYDDFDSLRASLGVTGQAVYQSAEDPNDITITHDFNDLAAAKAFAEGPELKSAMEGAGVAGPPTMWFTSPA